jgi:hypothetical protein
MTELSRPDELRELARNFQLGHGIRRKIRTFSFTKKFEHGPRYAQTFLFRKKSGISVSVLAPN